MNYVDSHGQSEIGFGITRLLDIDLLPRIKRINTVRLYRPEPAGAAGRFARLAPALHRPIRWDLIDENYDQVVKYAAAIPASAGGDQPPQTQRIRINTDRARSAVPRYPRKILS